MPKREHLALHLRLHGCLPLSRNCFIVESSVYCTYSLHGRLTFHSALPLQAVQPARPVSCSISCFTPPRSIIPTLAPNTAAHLFVQLYLRTVSFTYTRHSSLTYSLSHLFIIPYPTTHPALHLQPTLPPHGLLPSLLCKAQVHFVLPALIIRCAGDI